MERLRVRQPSAPDYVFSVAARWPAGKDGDATHFAIFWVKLRDEHGRPAYDFMRTDMLVQYKGRRRGAKR